MLKLRTELGGYNFGAMILIILGDDKKHVIILREFANIEAYNTWHAKRKELGDIDDLIKETDIPMHQNTIEF